MSIHFAYSKGAYAWENKYPVHTVCDLLLMLKVRKLYKLLGFDGGEKEVSNTDKSRHLESPESFEEPIYVTHVLQSQEKQRIFC